MFTRAILRKPAENFANGSTTAAIGRPDYQKTLCQHEVYCSALRACDLDLTVLAADMRYPDSTFVEDTAILTRESAIITNPGADSRVGEVKEIHEALSRFFSRIHRITPPGTLDGGDICEADGHFFIGISERTNEEGGRQLAGFLSHEGYGSTFIDIRDIPGILHLKSGISYIGDNNMVLIEVFFDEGSLQHYNCIHVTEDENYAANCIRVNDCVLLPAGYPRIREAIEGLGYPVSLLDMSEFQKMDGGLSCLSLRF
ncbi:MAG: hypothetical protein MUO76_17645 [Anaerolineaceae bacterium]|nr:hypothetical protein [Anaerolineaceae bacterium]